MPASAEATARARGGIKGYRQVKLKDGQTILVAIVPKAGPRGGHTVVLRGPVEGVKAGKPAPATSAPARAITRKRLRERLRRR